MKKRVRFYFSAVSYEQKKKTTITRGEHTTCPPDTQKDIQIQIQLPAGHPKVLGATTTAIRQKLA